jgi:glutaredoxin
MKEVHMFSKPDCIWCDRAKELLTKANLEIILYDVSEEGVGRDLFIKFGHKTVPQVYTDDGFHIGGYEDVKRWLEN